VFITGASGGIGLATVRALTRHGFHVYAGVRKRTALPALGAGVDVIEVDVTDPASVEAAAADVATRQGARGLRAVVNNAGIIVHGPLELTPAADMERQFAVNVLGPAEVIRAFLPLLRKGNGRIINISAPTARVAVPFAAPISASKAALESLSDAARIELAPWNIPVVIVVPGAIETAIFTKAGVTARAAMEAADPRQVALYAPQLEAVGKALSGQKTSRPETVADTIVTAIEAKKPKTRYIANSDARPFGLVSRLPTGLRDRLLTRMLGLNKVPKVPDGSCA
jgi:NAD(P)-dependent dehydrogenase (short-subunit alcohol dehydrogenase family)